VTVLPSMPPPCLRGLVQRLLLCSLVLLAGAAPMSAMAETLRIGVYHNPPKVLADEQGHISGIFGDLISAIAREENWQLETVACQWDHCLDLLASGEIDLMPDVAISDSRQRLFEFHQTPALLSWSQLYESGDHHLTSLLQLNGKRIAVLKGSIQEEYLQQLADNFDLAVEWVPVNTPTSGFMAVVQGSADAVAMNYFLGDAIAQQWDLVATPILFQPSKLFFAAPGGAHPDVLNAIDRHLNRWQADRQSPYFEVLKHWGIDRDKRAIPAALWWGIAALAIALSLALGFSQLLRRKVAEKTRDLSASEALLNTILDSVEAHIYIKDRNLRYQYANRHVCDLLGVTQEQIVGMSDTALFDAQTAATLQRNDLRVIEQGEKVVEEEINTVRNDGVAHTFLTVKLPLRNPDNSIYALCGISTDITEHINIREQLHQLAFFDPLTGLANRRLLLDRLKHAIASRASTHYEGALLLIDVNNFQSINDTLGHEIGDLLLQRIAQRLEQNLRSTDSAGRLGADEFVLIVADLSSDPEQAMMDARNQAQELLVQLAQPYQLGALSHEATVSIGVAMFSDASNVEGLLKGADLALSDAKSAGRNTLRFFNPAMQTEVNRRTTMENALRRAIKADQLQLHVQPQVDSSGEITGMEALLRWHDPELGHVPPSDFIPIAEASGQMITLGEWVLRRACAILADWAAIPPMQHLRLAVNISPQQFRHPRFVAQIEECIAHFSINPARLELEITENLLIDEMETTIARMNQLRARGIRFSLDDFGTGYSSLAYLKRLPLYQLKIDQSFVRDLLTDSNDEAIISTIIALGRSLDLQVIAEGVETSEQAERLRKLGCSAYQGYHFGKPKAPEHWQQNLAS